MRPSSSGVINPSGLVDKRLQPMWTKIEQVRQLLPQIAHVSYYMESIFNLDRNLTLLADENVDHHILKDIQIFQGATAYEIALAEGYVGDVTSWLASLVGPQGDPGLLDEVAHQELIDGIAANAAAAAAAQTTADAAESNFSNYVTLSEYTTRVAEVDSILDDLETTITDVVTPLLPTVRSDTEIGNIAQAKINTSLISVNNALTSIGATLDQYEIDISSVTTEHAATHTAFGEFLVDYGDTLAAISLLTASYNEHDTSITAIQSASALAASNILTLQANSATYSTQITALQLATANAATQINVLQVANNENAAFILEEQTARLSAEEAAAADRLLIRTEFAAADSSTLSSAAALVSEEASARSTAISAVTTSVTTLSSTVGDLTSTVAINIGTIADINGRLESTYAIAVDGGGNGAFFSLEDGTELPSAIILDADKITLDGDVFITGSVTGPEMFGANALNTGQVQEVPGVVNINSATWVDLASVTVSVPTLASFVLVLFSTQMASVGLYTHQVSSTLEFSITRNGVEIYSAVAAVNPGPITAYEESGGIATIGANSIIVPQSIYGMKAGFDIDLAPPSGTVTYVFRARRAAATGEPTRASFNLSDRKLVVDVRKR